VCLAGYIYAIRGGRGVCRPPTPPGYHGPCAAGYVYSLGYCYPAH
jgi:hypothetical protein